MRYKKYRLYILSEQKKLKKAGLLTSKVTPDSLLKAIAIRNSLKDEDPDLTEEQLLEISFLRNERPAIFPESPELVDAIIKSSFSAVDETAFPYGYGLIYMPKSHRLPSFMYSIINSEYMNELYSAYYDIKYRQMGFPKEKVEELKKQLFDAYSFEHKVLRISYYTKDKKLRIRTSPLAAMLPIIATDPSILSISFKECDSKHLPFEDDNEVEAVNEMMRFALGQIVYQKAKPELIHSGLPDIQATSNIGITKGRILESPISSTEMKDATIVGWFFRQLKDPKYYQGIHKSSPPGSRWVFVKPHIRGGTAKTIKDAKD